MGKIKIGILVLTSKVKDRMTRKNNYFDSLKYSGLKYIITEINKEKYTFEYCSSYNINNYEYVLVSLISYFDIFNFINQLKYKKITTKIIVGGATIANLRVLSKYIYAACIGRGETLINKILDKERIVNIWYKDNDPDFEQKYEIGQLKKLITIDNYKEKSVGCPNKCKFCQYSWKHKSPKTINYQSGIDNVEDMFKYLNWDTAKSRAISAIDGTTEQTRKKVSKKLSNDEIYNKLLEVYKLKYEKPLYLKLFNIVGFPWEDETLNFEEIKNIFKKADKKKKTHTIWVKIFNNHFKPMPFTPFEQMPVSKINYREKFKNNIYIYIGNNFEVLISPYGTSPATACEETLINRSYNSELIEKIYTSKKYLNLRSDEKVKVFEKYNPEVFEIMKKLPTDLIETPFKIKHINY